MASENEKYETLADIVAQMRGRGEDGRMDRRLWLDYADRIEAAAKRDDRASVGNAARVRKYNAKMLQVSARFYAMNRMYRRKSHAKKVVLSGKPYRPLYSRRIPDWCVKGERIIDYRSQFLPENITPSMAAYARSLAMERRGLEVWE